MAKNQNRINALIIVHLFSFYVRCHWQLFSFASKIQKRIRTTTTTKRRRI